MHIIESNPALYERLAAALNVQLRLGGVYIADTDLFQRDVTRFLNADIGPIYFVAKQLLRAFPVYFNDVGAEGELRAVSTEIDEICGRQDTLMHFLRKQSHAESSNRLVDFSRGSPRLLGHARPGRPAALSLGQHLERRAPRTALGRGAAQGPRGARRALLGRCRPRPGATSVPTGGRRDGPRRRAAVGRRGRRTSSTACVKLTPEALARLLATLPDGERDPGDGPAPRGPHDPHAPVAGPEVLPVGRQHRQRRQPPPAARRQDPGPLRQGPRRLAERTRLGHPRPPARRVRSPCSRSCRRSS